MSTIVRDDRASHGRLRAIAPRRIDRHQCRLGRRCGPVAESADQPASLRVGMSTPSPKQYYAERHGRGPAAIPLSEDELRRLVFSVWDKFEEDGYFQKSMGYDCVDADGGHSDGDLGSDPGAHFFRKLRLAEVWPYREHEASYDVDTLLSVGEVLRDLVAKPVDGQYHSFAGCGMHYHSFDEAAGRTKFRVEMNEVLGLADPPHSMDDGGLIVQLGPVEFRRLLAAELPSEAEHDLVVVPLNEAVARFRRHGASVEDQRHAVRDLASVLEAIRGDVKATMLSADESALFNLANNFALRHNNRHQKGDYDRSTWLTWAFYVYLATIHAVLRVRDRPAHRDGA